MIDIWTEKYRPETLSEVVGHEEIINRLKAFVDEESIPHMLFAGPAGTGKTTSAVALAKDLYGDSWNQNFMEMNASDERGINVVREQIKDFARTKPVNADYKIIFLDEADSLTQDAQQALRRTMEQFSSNCRFIMSCNYSSKIIDPIQSRCALFRFQRLEEDKIKSLISRIGKKEGFQISEEAINAVMRVSEGDLRRVTNILQTAAIQKEKITEEDVYDVAASLRPEEINEILEKALEGEFMDARSELSDLMIDRGLDGQDIISSIHREIFDLDIPEKAKLQIMEQLGETEYRLVEGGSGDIQIESLLAKISEVGNQ